MSLDTLHILYGDTSVGTLAYDRKRDEITLNYEESWQFGSESFPASLSLPLAKRVHPDERLAAPHHAQHRRPNRPHRNPRRYAGFAKTSNTVICDCDESETPCPAAA